MPDNANNSDELDAFFAAAENDDSSALQKAADRVATDTPVDPFATALERETDVRKRVKADTSMIRGTRVRNVTQIMLRQQETASGATAKPLGSTTKRVAVRDTRTLRTVSARESGFNLSKLLPWWGWLSIALVIVGIFVAVLFLPLLQLSGLTSRLGEDSESSQHAMRQLVLQGDERTVRTLYDMAASPEEAMDARLRAIDTLSLIREPAADHALHRLELGTSSDAKIRAHAAAARKQRAATLRNNPIR